LGCYAINQLKMTKHKHQHFIPSSYLEAWCDKNSPPGQKPYIWLITKDGCEIKKKAPEKIFFETDFYTIMTKNGERDLQIEYTLSRLEDKFTKIRTHKLNQKNKLSQEEHLYLCLFTAAMLSRTKAFGEYNSGQWKKALDMAEKLNSAVENASSEQRQRMIAALSTPSPNKENIMTMDEVKEIVDYPIQSLLPTYVEELAPAFLEMPFIIFHTENETGFITSDDPCVWYDPANYVKPRPFGAGGLVSPTLEITFPLSPKQLLVIAKSLPASGIYIDINNIEYLNEINHRTRFFSKEYIVSNKQKIEPLWFQ
jgi:hypothetical protein